MNADGDDTGPPAEEAPSTTTASAPATTASTATATTAMTATAATATAAAATATAALGRRWPIVLTLRWRLSLALLLSVAVAVAAGTGAHLVEVSDRLERDLLTQAMRVTGAIRTDLEATATALDEELAVAADPRAGVARLIGAGRIETRFLGAQARLVTGRLEVLKVLLKDGTILTSGHWPASFGALDPLIEVYAKDAGRLPRIVDEPTPSGSSAALERWSTLRVSGRELVIVAGRFLDQPALERLRSRTGADLIALCRDDGPGKSGVADTPNVASNGVNGVNGGINGVGGVGVSDTRADDRPSKFRRGGPTNQPTCLSASAPNLIEAAFAPHDRAVTQRMRLDVIDVGGLTLYIGMDRSGIERVRSGIIGRAVLVGFLSVVFAVVVGALLARRLVRPIEDLADAAARVARGDLSARVDDPKTGGEVQDLVDAFNTMARDLESGQKRLLQAERVAAWQEIARGLAHELKNPLTPILSAMDVIRRARQLGRADFDDILAEQASAVVEEVMRLKELADAFARFARLPEKRIEPLQIDELIDHALALYASGVSVERRLRADLPAVYADRTQLMTVFSNLVKNANEAIGDVADADKKIGVDIDIEDDTFVVCIDDNGPGIAAEVKDRLFAPYVTTKGSRGTGLGLALSHRIVAEHKGSIEGSTSPWGGARFIVRVPIGAPQSPVTP
jgi:signal transduction histidine kinase